MIDSPKTPKQPAPLSPVVAFASWLVPGAGYWLLKERARAMTVGITILILFVLGTLIGGVQVIDAPTFGRAQFVEFPGRVLQKPWFIGQALVGPISIVCAMESAHLSRDPQASQMKAHAHLMEIGTLYTAVAGMLNLMAIIDAASRASAGGSH